MKARPSSRGAVAGGARGKRAGGALRKWGERMRELAARLDASTEAERALLGRELHDLVGQDLTAMRLELAALRGRLPREYAAAAEKLDSVAAILEATARSVRRISRKLGPAVQDGDGLGEAVLWHAREVRERTGIRCEVDFPEEEPVLPAAVANPLFRIVQEACADAERRGGATRVRIRLERRGEWLLLTVRDDGNRPGEGAASLAEPVPGLAALRERVRLWGGDVTVRRSRGKGACVEALVLLPGADGDA